MAVGDTEQESSICRKHDTHKVAFYCQTCDDLICARCISRAPNNPSTHREHVYLELSEAYGLLREDLEKLCSQFKSELQSRKNERHEYHNKLQEVRLELLRKKHSVENKTQLLKARTQRAESEYMNKLEAVLQPAIERCDERFKAADYEVVSWEGLAGEAESVLMLPEHSSVKFVLRATKLKKALLQAIDSNVAADEVDSFQEVKTLHKQTFLIHKQKRVIDQSFSIAKEEPTRPKLLMSWSTVGTTSTSLVWKYKPYQRIQYFNVYYTTYRRAHKNLPENPALLRKSDMENFLSFRISEFPHGRVQAVLRNLEPGTWYTVRLSAVNDIGESTHSVYCVKTAKCFDGTSKGDILAPGDSTHCIQIRDVIVNAILAVTLCIAFALLFIYRQEFTDFTRESYEAYRSYKCQRLKMSGNMIAYKEQCPQVISKVPTTTTPLPPVTPTKIEGSNFWKSWKHPFDFIVEIVTTLLNIKEDGFSDKNAR